LDYPPEGGEDDSRSHRWKSKTGGCDDAFSHGGSPACWSKLTTSAKLKTKTGHLRFRGAATRRAGRLVASMPVAEAPSSTGRVAGRARQFGTSRRRSVRKRNRRRIAAPTRQLRRQEFISRSGLTRVRIKRSRFNTRTVHPVAGADGARNPGNRGRDLPLDSHRSHQGSWSQC
jgi:hypothetical protein